MSRAALFLILPVVLACTKKDEPAAGPAGAASTEVVSAPAGMNLAGRWSVRVMPEDRDTTVIMYVLEATNTNTGWKMTLPNRNPMDIRVIHMDSDSIVVENGPYSSALQRGVMVSTHSNVHLEGDKLVGRTLAHYQVNGPDSLRVFRTEGVRQ